MQYEKEQLKKIIKRCNPKWKLLKRWAILNWLRFKRWIIENWLDLSLHLLILLVTTIIGLGIGLFIGFVIAINAMIGA